MLFPDIRMNMVITAFFVFMNILEGKLIPRPAVFHSSIVTRAILILARLDRESSITKPEGLRLFFIVNYCKINLLPR